jgi:hypothetical protein
LGNFQRLSGNLRERWSLGRIGGACIRAILSGILRRGLRNRLRRSLSACLAQGRMKGKCNTRNKCERREPTVLIGPTHIPSFKKERSEMKTSLTSIRTSHIRPPNGLKALAKIAELCVVVQNGRKWSVSG